MKLNKITINSKEALADHIKSGKASYYYSSATSTVIPYDKIESYLSHLDGDDLFWVNLSTMPEEMELDDSGVLTISGPVTWQSAKQYCRSKGRDIMTSPTEELASVLSGLATSATGERCFGFGTLRDQVEQIEYCSDKGEFILLNSSREIEESEALRRYRETYSRYIDFKNAPFPRMLNETDQLIGTEGQLGVVTQAKIRTTTFDERTFIFIKLPRWEQEMIAHLEVFEKVQSFRDRIFSCELLDFNSMKNLPEQEKVTSEGDIIFLEVKTKSFEAIYDELLSSLIHIREEDIFEVSASRCNQLRMNVPRYTFEMNLKMGVVKKGTDVQVSVQDFPTLLEFYREWTRLGIDYNLFGHFGDGHLHFNFLPTAVQVDQCQEKLVELYDFISELGGSPFAEHGIGLIKQKFITNFWEEAQYNFFSELKRKMDPKNIFFPLGFLSLKRTNS
ncbi:FAD-binding oxidoreductase [Halobacteriovorax sp. HLS]|uniref:FAD-binding oxidoreductase n=1 Tax=Halobacteriovorax sp. HLS TaxID=2234000 RepID=UPI000FDA0457|nr:FAD-binding oxidoreductase [Halobacteriovorax sp. HLS]